MSAALARDDTVEVQSHGMQRSLGTFSLNRTDEQRESIQEKSSEGRLTLSKSNDQNLFSDGPRSAFLELFHPKATKNCLKLKVAVKNPM